MPDEPPGWAQPGQPVIVIGERGGFRHVPTVRRAVVERHTLRDVVLDDGTRFRKDSLRQASAYDTEHYVIPGKGDFRSGTEVRPPDDPKVARARAQVRHQRLRDSLYASLDRVEKALRADAIGDDAMSTLIDQMEHYVPKTET